MDCQYFQTDILYEADVVGLDTDVEGLEYVISGFIRLLPYKTRTVYQ